jgi:hypothetical protein
MVRLLLAACLACAATFAGSTAQDKKDPPKKAAKIVIAEPKDLEKDADFAIQGEYEDEIPGLGEKVGIQVVAKGEGKFAVKAFKGGLPGNGADPKDVLTGTAETKDGKVVATMKKGTDTSTATIGDGKFVVSAGGDTLTFKKVERKSKTLGEKPPAGAMVLFDVPGDKDNWKNGKVMELSDGKFLTVSKTGNITTKESFGAFKVHIEFRLAWMPNSTGQGRSNSGVYLQDRYELQVLDSFGLNGENNECGGFYTQHKPSVNMCYPPMTWQTYDIDFTPAQFENGKKTKNARATVLHNGVKIHDDVEFPKDGPGGKPEAATPGPFQFQDHGDPVVYRNVWVVRVK